MAAWRLGFGDRKARRGTCRKREASLLISLVVKEEIRIHTSAFCQVTDDCLSIASSNCVHLIVMIEIYKSLLVNPILSYPP